MSIPFPTEPNAGTGAAPPAHALGPGPVHLPDAAPWTSFHTVADLLTHAVEHHPRTGLRYPAADDPRDSVAQSYPTLLAEASRLLAGLRAAGLRPRDNVVLLLRQPDDYVPAFWACVLGGFVPCPLRPQATDTARWSQQVRHVDALLERPLWLTTKALCDELPQAGDAADLSVRLIGELTSATPESAYHRAERDDTALLMLTSGSTGHPKAVRLSHANLLAALPAKAERLGATACDTTMNWISFDHISAIEMHLLPTSVGATQVQVAPESVLGDPLRFLRLADAHRVTLTFTPNFLFAQLNRAMDRLDDGFTPDLSALRRVISGGEATVCATVRGFLDRLAPFGLDRGVVSPAFGMTETCAGSVFSLDFPDVDDGQEFASLGRAVAGLEMRVVGADDAPLPGGRDGELQVRGPMVFDGYLGDAAATAAAFTPDGWFRTGDRGRIDDGRLTLVGRSKDSIIVNGVNYFSHDLETVLERLDGVAKSYIAAFPIRPQGSDTEQLAVLFAPDLRRQGGAADGAGDDGEADLYRLIVAIRSSTVLHWGFRPSLILPLPMSAVPKTSLGKIQRSQLRERLEAGEFAAAEADVAALVTRRLGGYTAPVGETEAALAEIYAEMFDADPAEISATASFFDLGGTSLDILRLKGHVERAFGLRDLPVVGILRAPTIRELAARIDGAGGGGGQAGSQGAAAPYDPLVPLQLSGDKTPLFCVHPGVGEVLVFVNLAKYFVSERPFHALRARGFGEGEDYFATFGEMVECYVRAIRDEQPLGPYAVAGYSYGGIVAFEIAKALEALGERVDFVGIFNLPPHVQDRMAELDFVEGAVNLAFFLSLITKEQSVELPGRLRDGLTRRQQLDYLMDIAPPGRLAELDLDVAKFGAWVDLAQSLVRLGRTYEPSGNVRSLSVFYAVPLRGTKEDWLDTQLRPWDGFAREENRYIDVPGEHYTLMGPEHVASFQAILRTELDRALGEGRSTEA
ncbi:acyl-CoA synthetase (AMP-forming)/AMP-acid ligase II/thioesterase domain-containing protein/acyl carrier protein [Nocardiopsis mwathae]|uniref:Acyl-CoA synthetase (AMP-forming)/AMP-acid ligase II/thioesterase domain-containing protein/acyl carrier protein n=1 Tax=Nocardiopsis mwathae TaxID=1472723 RepID=A0A7X0D551_9ACTN|nr:non-ribosomal peptide synthetase [Nocardiopsis mwathae]MBB6171858.1 acyl-CoA synthetase (AMP-forming)/AMP-acid ligase II/thioesterase domain-containing protein/acyl carrier protein [Nocardiopsis mwathae]